MSLIVPPQHIALLKRWLELRSEEVAKFSSALETSKAQFNSIDLANSIIPNCDLPPELIAGILEVLISVYRTGEPEKPFEKFLDEYVRPTLTRSKTFSEGKEEEEWGRLRAFMLHALSLEGILGTTAKAGMVLTEHERIFDSARVLTDFRPIFHIDASEKPEAGVIIHMLKITTRDKYAHKFDTYFALDSNDVKKMKSILDRALQKAETLQAAIGDEGLRVLEVKLTY